MIKHPALRSIHFKTLKKYILLSFFSCCLAINVQGQTFPNAGKLQPQIAITNHKTLTYSLYIPKSGTANCAILFFDPHGNGNVPITLYQTLADAFNIVLIGNNNSANGMNFNTISENFNTLLIELKEKYNISEKNIILWGFSGGAKAAMYVSSMHTNIHYCIYGGAFWDIPNTNSNLNLLGFNGNKDMNYTDLLSFADAQKNNPNHYQIEFTGKHAWPDTTTAKDAFRWILLKKMQQKEIPINKPFVLKIQKEYQHQLESLKTKKNLLEAYLTCNKAIYFLKSLCDITYFQQQQTQIAASADFSKELAIKQASYKKEVQQKMQLQNDFFEKDTLYWKHKIDELHKNEATDFTGVSSRLLGFLSLAAYSYAQHAFAENNKSALVNILFIYQHADPKNPEQAFMRAKYYALLGNYKSAKIALEEAKKLGIENSRILQEPMLKGL